METTNTPQKHPSAEQAILSWVGEVEIEHERSSRWYVIASIFVLALIVYSIWTQSWSFALLIGLMVGTYYFVHTKKIPPKQVNVHSHGIYLGEKYYAWTECEAFWILQGPGYFELHIKTKRRSSNDVKIQTGDMDPITIREALSVFLPELSEQTEKTLDKLQRILKI